jgi:hypothetical protein
MRIVIKLAILHLFLFSFACKQTEPREGYARDKVSAICRAQNQYFKQNKRYGTIGDLVDAELIKSEWLTEWGYKSEVKLTETGYLATVTPNTFEKAGLFYVDEKKIIKVHYGDTNIQPNDAECSYSNGAKCPCYDE